MTLDQSISQLISYLTGFEVCIKILISVFADSKCMQGKKLKITGIR